VISDLPRPSHDLRHLDPEVRKERVKLVANGFNAIGLALLIGSWVAPIVDVTRQADWLRSAVGSALGAVCLVAAFVILRYMKGKEIT
jgi:uncharacterized membrane protein YraQ (UPF0718 family)